MATVIRVQELGNELKVLFSDGSHVIAYPANSIWVAANNTNGVLSLREFGNQIGITYEDGTIDIGYKTSVNLYYVKGTYAPGPDWIWPVHYKSDGVTKWNLGDGYGPRVDPVTGIPGIHWGQDINGAGISNFPIVSPSHGIVRSVGSNPSASYGYNVQIEHDDGTGTLCAHMIALAVVTVGQTVSIGQHIGNVGATGQVTGTHLHYNTQTAYAANANTNAVDPLAFMAARGAPW